MSYIKTALPHLANVSLEHSQPSQMLEDSVQTVCWEEPAHGPGVASFRKRTQARDAPSVRAKNSGLRFKPTDLSSWMAQRGGCQLMSTSVLSSGIHFGMCKTWKNPEKKNLKGHHLSKLHSPGQHHLEGKENCLYLSYVCLCLCVCEFFLSSSYDVKVT